MWALRRLEYACEEKCTPVRGQQPNVPVVPQRKWHNRNVPSETWLLLWWWPEKDWETEIKHLHLIAKAELSCFPTAQKAQRTTVLIFLLPSDALIRHLLSAGSNDSEWPFLGTGLVLPSSGRNTSIKKWRRTGKDTASIPGQTGRYSHFFKVMTTLPDVLHFWNSRVSSVRNWREQEEVSGFMAAEDLYTITELNPDVTSESIYLHYKIWDHITAVSFSLLVYLLLKPHLLHM